MRFIASTVVGVLFGMTLTLPGAAEEVTAGTLIFQFAKAGCVSAVATNWPEVSAILCHELGDRVGGSEDCRLTAGDRGPDPDPRPDPDYLVLELFPSDLRGTSAIEVIPRDLAFRGPELLTPCGAWGWNLELDEREAQPVSKIELHPLIGEPANGVTSGVLQVSASMHFRNEDSGEERSLPRFLEFDFVVRWALGRPWSTVGTNLYLPTGPDGSIVPACLNEVKKCGRLSLVAVERLPGSEK